MNYGNVGRRGARPETLASNEPGLSAARRPRLPEVLVVLAPVLAEFVLSLVPSFASPHGPYWEALLGQAAFASAALAVVLSRCSSWGSIGLFRTGLASSLALGVLYCLAFFLLLFAAVWLGLLDSLNVGAMIEEPGRFLGTPLAFALYLPFWGVFESVWMAYLIFTVNRWLVGYGALRWRALLLAALYFGVLHALTQILWAGTPPAQALGSVIIGLALLIPGTIPKLTGNAWGLVLWFTVTNFGW